MIHFGGQRVWLACFSRDVQSAEAAVVAVALAQGSSRHVQRSAAVAALVAQAFRYWRESLTCSARWREIVDVSAALGTLACRGRFRVAASKAPTEERTVRRGAAWPDWLSTPVARIVGFARDESGERSQFDASIALLEVL